MEVWHKGLTDAIFGHLPPSFPGMRNAARLMTAGHRANTWLGYAGKLKHYSIEEIQSTQSSIQILNESDIASSYDVLFPNASITCCFQMQMHMLGAATKHITKRNS